MIKAEELDKFEVGSVLRKIGLPHIARRIVVKSVKGRLVMYPVDEDVYIVDKEKGVIYTNDNSVYDKVCYPVLGSKSVVCFPNKPVVTDPKKVQSKPLDRDRNEEAIIAIEDMLDDSTAYGHFAYYCRTRGGHPILVDTDEGLGMVCVGGKVDNYAIISESVADEFVDLAKDLPDGGRALTLLYLGRKYSDAMTKTKMIIPVEQYQRFGLSVHFVE